VDLGLLYSESSCVLLLKLEGGEQLFEDSQEVVDVESLDAFVEHISLARVLC
jgi:hypothetical protein